MPVLVGECSIDKVSCLTLMSQTTLFPRIQKWIESNQPRWAGWVVNWDSYFLQLVVRKYSNHLSWAFEVKLTWKAWIPAGNADTRLLIALCRGMHDPEEHKHWWCLYEHPSYKSSWNAFLEVPMCTWTSLETSWCPNGMVLSGHLVSCICYSRQNFVYFPHWHLKFIPSQTVRLKIRWQIIN